MADSKILCIDDEYQFTWWKHKSDWLERTRGYYLEDIGELVLSGGVCAAWVPPPTEYSHQSRVVFRLSDEFYTLAVEDCRDVKGYDHLITYFLSNDQDVDRYFKEHGRR